MSKRRVNGAARAAMDPLPQAVCEPAALRCALAVSQQQAKAAQRKIETLTQSNWLLQQEVARLVRQVAQTRHFAYHDELTGLPNRSLLMDRLNQAIVQAARQHKRVALLLLDLDGFKSVNDRRGHAAGDELLRQAAQRLVACIRGADTACRYGGDEFVIMLPEFDGSESVSTVAEKVHIHLAAPYAIGGEAISVTASIGTATYPDDGENYHDLIEHADIAMYRAKAHRSVPANVLQQTMRT
jgi:diguanylate cyclase